jgi:hypothetical protein
MVLSCLLKPGFVNAYVSLQRVVVSSCTQIDHNGEPMHLTQPPAKKVEYTFLIRRLVVSEDFKRLSLKDARCEIMQGGSVGVEEPNAQLPIRQNKAVSSSNKSRTNRAAPEITAKLTQVPSQSTSLQ